MTSVFLCSCEPRWPDAPSVPFTAGLPRTVQLALNFTHVGLAKGCWQFAPLFTHNGTAPATRGTAVPALSRGERAPAGGATYELTVAPRGMGLWELERCP